MAELGRPASSATVLKMDNSSAIDLANDPVMHTASTHILRRDLFLRKLVERGEIQPKFVKTSENIADALTKPLAKALFQAHREKLLGC